MNQDEFIKWLRGEYWPKVEQPKDEQGGFLVPHFVTANKAGKKAAFYRWLGILLRNPRIYKMGTYQLDLHKALMERR